MTQLPSIHHPTPTHQQSPSAFIALPPEIHTIIAKQLAYPDLLSLTLSHPIFMCHPDIRTTKTSRVDWLLSRATQHLTLPTRTRCRWSSDREFVSNPEVTSIIRRRRSHAECVEVWKRGHSAGECLVLDGKGRCVKIGEGDSKKDMKWIQRVRWELGGLSGFVVEVRSGGSRTSGVINLMRSRRIAFAVVITVACLLYLLV